MDRRRRSTLDHRRERRPVRVSEPRRLTRCFAVNEALGAMSIQLQHPVPHDLQRHPANHGSLRARRPVVDGSQGQKAPGLRSILRPLGSRSQLHSIEISPERKRHRHGKPPLFAVLKQINSSLKTLISHNH